MEITHPHLRKTLNADYILALLHKEFEKIPDHRRNGVVSMSDTLMAAFAMFSLKEPSLLALDERRNEGTIRGVYGLSTIPPDTTMRRTLDMVEPSMLLDVFPTLFTLLQRGKGMEDMAFYEGYYLLSNDGTGYFNSDNIHCDDCLIAQHSDGRKSYSHQFLGSVIVHPDHKVVIPLSPEPIKNGDGSDKNDCELNAHKRLLPRFRKQHPHLKAIMVEDALAANAPHIKDLTAHDLRFIIRIKQGSHGFLFRALKEEEVAHATTDVDGVRYTFRFKNDVGLNASRQDVRVNVFSAEATFPDQSTKSFTWITDLLITTDNVYQLMRGGRARWKVENETFNTLKNQGYNFEHNYGHGHHNLSTVLAILMMLAFLVDQILQKCCPLFQLALQTMKRKIRLWERLRMYATLITFTSMNAILWAIATRLNYPPPNTS
jgi:hypothetical protein